MHNHMRLYAHPIILMYLFVFMRVFCWCEHSVNYVHNIWIFSYGKVLTKIQNG